MERNEGKCAWKKVAENDLEKRARGDNCITLSIDKRCYECPGTEEYARKVNCGAYHQRRGE
ncbi:hypothetical protein A3K73_07830 [Candidatus Pacearchaeota archaeon RBG_13_36_9]|nr:MAG: hypothetical protein A3K73_07830 [Candidatus Pacearchaeota archaeon RBG_13_36_9]